MKHAVIAGILVAAAITPAAMSQYGRRPHRDEPQYLRARSNLRAALFYLRGREEPNVAHHMREAAREVDEAIRQVSRAAIADGRDLDRRPPPDFDRMDYRGRIGRAMDLLRDAREDLSRGEDNPEARHWRNAANRNIDAAIDYLREAMRDKARDRGDGRRYR